MLLNAGLKTPELTRRFKQNRRIVIRDVLAPAAADQIFDCMTRDVKWGLAYQDDTGPQFIERDRLDALPEADRNAIEHKIQSRARETFQYRYRCYPMLDAYLQRRDPGLARVVGRQQTAGLVSEQQDGRARGPNGAFVVLRQTHSQQLLGKRARAQSSG